MNSTDKKLEKETEKWLSRLESEIKDVKASDESGRKHFTNMKAYISDSRHFLKKKDFIRAFECAVWSWSIYELCIDAGIFMKK